jgi:hypothetical protein
MHFNVDSQKVSVSDLVNHIELRDSTAACKKSFCGGLFVIQELISKHLCHWLCM